MKELYEIKHLIVASEYVGSRVTCNPPPTDTDLDILVLATPNAYMVIEAELLDKNWTIGGSLPSDAARVELLHQESFNSYKRDDVNIILTANSTFYAKFLLASSVCKKLNLLKKPDRIDVFQAILYGNAPE